MKCPLKYSIYVILIQSVLSLSLFAQITWQHMNGPPGGYIRALGVDPGNDDIYAGMDNGLFVFRKNDTDWARVENGLEIKSMIRSIAISGPKIFVGTSEGVFFSSDRGASWTPFNEGLTSTDIYALAINDSNIYVGTMNGVFLSTTDGSLWTPITAIGGIAYTFAFDGQNILVGTNTGRLFLFNENDSNWVPINNGITDKRIRILTGKDSKVLAASASRIFLSHDRGANWSMINDQLYLYLGSLALSDTDILVGTNDEGVYISSDNGTKWESMNNGLTDTTITSLCIHGSTFYAGTFHQGVFLFDKIGASWKEINSGLINTSISCMNISGSNIFAGTAGGGIFVADITSNLDGIDKKPASPVLYQNYPNPFNPGTTIKIYIPYRSEVVLKIYNSLGEVVETLISKKTLSGFHQVQWNSNKYSSGVYFYRLQANKDIVETKKMVVIR